MLLTQNSFRDVIRHHQRDTADMLSLITAESEKSHHHVSLAGTMIRKCLFVHLQLDLVASALHHLQWRLPLDLLPLLALLLDLVAQLHLPQGLVGHQL